MTDTVVVSPAPAPAPPAASSITQHIPLMLAAIVSLGFLTMLVIMAFHDIPDKNAALINALLGSLGASFTMIVGFYFGSSASSQRKDDTISKLSQ